MISCALSAETSAVVSNISRPSSRALTARTRSRYSTTAWSRSVVVGELRITVSDMIAQRSSIAVARLGSIPFWRKRSTTSVAVEPTGSNVARTGIRVSIEPMWWWSRISTISAWSTPITLCASSAWSTSRTRRRGGATRSDRVTRPTGRRLSSIDDGGAVVGAADLLGGVAEQIVGRHRQRVDLHQRAARRRERDHAARDVRVERRDDQRRATCSRASASTSASGGAPLERTSRAAPRSIASRCASARLPTTTMSPSEIPVGPLGSIELTHTRPDSCRSSPQISSAVEHVDDRVNVRRRLMERRTGARLTDVPAGERPRGDDAEQPAVVVDHRHDIDIGVRHLEPRGPDGLVVANLRELGLHHVAGAQHHVRKELRLRGAGVLQNP